MVALDRLVGYIAAAQDRPSTATAQAGVGLITGTVQTTAKVVDDAAR
ncbi:MAG: hypothetical protein ABGW87_12765 [Sphingomonadaceae bacterium]